MTEIQLSNVSQENVCINKCQSYHVNVTCVMLRPYHFFTFEIQWSLAPWIYGVDLIQLFRLVLSDNVLFFPHNTLSSKCRPCWLYYSVYTTLQQLGAVQTQKIFYPRRVISLSPIPSSHITYQPSHDSLLTLSFLSMCVY